MVDGRRKDAWDRTAALGAWLLNAWRDSKSPEVSPLKLHPMRRGEADAAARANQHQVSGKEAVGLWASHLKARPDKKA